MSVESSPLWQLADCVQRLAKVSGQTSASVSELADGMSRTTKWILFALAMSWAAGVCLTVGVVDAGKRVAALEAEVKALKEGQR